jgi:hypothetical protein
MVMGNVNGSNRLVPANDDQSPITINSSPIPVCAGVLAVYNAGMAIHRHPVARGLALGLPLAAVVLAAGVIDGPPPSQAGPFAAPVRWRPLFDGIDHAELSAYEPRLLRGHALRVDTARPGVGFLATPDNGDRPGETDGLRTSTFLERYGCRAAVNATMFGPVHRAEGLPQEVTGLLVSGGRLVSGPAGNCPALVFDRDGRARVVAAPPFDLRDVEHAVGGMYVVLRGGAVLPGDAALHPRTAAGVAADGRTVYLLVIDGRQPLHSDGATQEDVGQWLKALGAADGLNLDGGGTTTMAVAGPDGRPVVLNSPVDGGLPGAERVTGAHLGVYARPLPGHRQWTTDGTD